MMLEQLFITLLQLSFTTGIVILLLLLLSAYMNQHFAAKWRNWIWLVLAVRLIIPLNITLPNMPVAVSIPNVQLQTVVNDTLTQTDTNTGTSPSQTETVIPQNESTTSPGDQTASFTWMEVAMIIWLLGCCGFLTYQIAGYQIFKKKALRWSRTPENPKITETLGRTASEMGIKRDIAVLISGSVASPLMIGFINPRLFLPGENYSDADLAFILRHELTHYKRKDLWYKLLLLLANGVHWFNPLVWLMFRAASEAVELSCDDEVTRGIGFGGRKAYSEAILASISGKGIRQAALTTYFSGGKNTLKSRFSNILDMKHKKNGMVLLLVVVLVLGILGGLVGCTTGDAQSAADTPVTSTEETGPFVGYVENATTDTFDVYTEENGTYIMSLPVSVFFDVFPASDRTDPNWQAGWMNVDVYCGTIDDFTWAVVCTGPSAGTGNANVCTSMDGGTTWWVGDRSAMYTGTVTGAGFASSEIGFMSYRYFFDQGPEISRTLDGGKTWERMTVDIPDYLKQYNMTPLVPSFTGDSGIYPIELYDSDSNFTAITYLTTEDGGMTWSWNENALSEAVRLAFLKDMQGDYLSGECIGEGHIILGQDEESGITTVYALTMYGEYGFEDGNFVKVSGSGIIPAVFTFTDSEDGLVCTKIEYPQDGTRMVESIKTLFPSKYQSRALSPSDQDMQDLTSQERSYAASYLKEIGRDAVIGDYGDFEHTLLTEVGVSVEVSNITCDSLYCNYPMWIGNREALENGVRYVYEMSYNKDAHEIDFTKYEYDTGSVVELMRLDSITGLQIN